MKRLHLLSALLFVSVAAIGQENDGEFSTNQRERDEDIQTVFNGSHAVGGYGALVHKFTTIDGKFAHVPGVYGGVYLNHRLFVGIAVYGSTNHIAVDDEFSVQQGVPMTYQFGQAGLQTEYSFGSNKAFHVNFTAFAGSGFTIQYPRERWDRYDDDFWESGRVDENWFFVVEPGVQLEINLLKWMRISPGVSYRLASGGNGSGLSDRSLSAASYSMTLKFGRF
jgi:hypothetical protein